MITKLENKFYAVVTVNGDEQYLCEVEEDVHETMIHHTTRDIHSERIMRFSDKDEALKMAESIKNDAHSDEPMVVHVTINLEIEGV